MHISPIMTHFHFEGIEPSSKHRMDEANTVHTERKHIPTSFHSCSSFYRWPILFSLRVHCDGAQLNSSLCHTSLVGRNASFAYARNNSREVEQSSSSRSDPFAISLYALCPRLSVSFSRPARVSSKSQSRNIISLQSVALPSHHFPT